MKKKIISLLLTFMSPFCTVTNSRKTHKKINSKMLLSNLKRIREERQKKDEE